MKKKKYLFSSPQKYFVTIISILTLFAISPIEAIAEENNQNLEETIIEEIPNKEINDSEKSIDLHTRKDQEETNKKSEKDLKSMTNNDADNNSKDNQDSNLHRSDTVNIEEEKKLDNISREEKENNENKTSQTQEKSETLETQSTLDSSEHSLSEGNSSLEIQTFKEDLTAAGFTTWTSPNDYYGPETVEYVKDFQEYYGLEVTGNGDDATLSKLAEVLNSPYQSGNSSAEIREIKNNLKALGYADHWNVPNNDYGPETVEVVKKFQADYGLVVNGIVDEITYAKIDGLINAPLTNGAVGLSVQEFKEDLTAAGFTTWNRPNQNYGPETVEYVKDFQEYYGLEVTGNGDDATLSKLAEVLNSPYQSGNSSPEIQQIKTQLMTLGFANHWTIPNNDYGPETIEVVENFQSYYGLVPNGIIDSVTKDKIDSILNTPYQSGNSSSEIKDIKTTLMHLGFTSWTDPNGDYGPQTVEVVKNFQSYYGLVINGVIDPVTEETIDSVLNSHFTLGNSSTAIQEVKTDIMNLGFAPQWTNPNNDYGPEAVQAVKEFQAYYNLAINGIVDSVTKEKINTILNSHFTLGNSSSQIKEVKTDLMLLGFANHWYNPNENYGPETVDVVKNFQEVYNLPISGIVDEITHTKISSLMEQRVFTEYNLTFNQALNMQMKVNPQTDRNYAYVSKDFVDKNGKVTASALNVRSGAGSSNSIVGSLAQGNKVNIISEVNGWYQIEYSGAGWVNAVRKDVGYYMNPNNFTNTERQLFQFLNLSRPSGVTPSELNEFLKGKGILEDMGQVFIDAGRTHGVNEVYLLAHALLETGHGTSELATGIKVNGVTVYNMFGIGAYDGVAKEAGSRRAYEEGWTTPEKAIVGGARFIGNNYIQAGQNTLYKIRWNPEAMSTVGYATHQYATDIGWAYKQVNTMYNLYNDIGINNRFLDIPVYK